jgi:prepilin-type N-terminal cleavage/methylation domain-containing protein
MKTHPFPRDERGFTMVELLITLVVASVITSSIYFVFRNQSRIFHVQESVAQMQADLRFAMQTLKGDLKRAGYLAALNTTGDNFWCGNRPVPAMTALQVTDGGGFVHLPASNVNVNPDSLRILGAFNVSAAWYTQAIQGTAVTFNTTPLLSPGFPTTQTDFDRVFAPGTLLRILDNQNRYQIQRITATNFGASSVTLQNVNRDPVSGCGPRGIGDANIANPVEYVRYRIVDTGTSAATCGNAPSVVGRSTLVRENLAPDGATVLNTLQVADYIVDLQFTFMADTTPLGGTPNIAADPSPYDFVGNITAAALNANPQQARSVGVFLAARTPQEDPDFVFRPRPGPFTFNGTPSLGPLTSFELDTNRPGSCRVRTLSSEVQLRNFSLSPRL